MSQARPSGAFAQPEGPETVPFFASGAAPTNGMQRHGSQPQEHEAASRIRDWRERDLLATEFDIVERRVGLIVRIERHIQVAIPMSAGIVEHVEEAQIEKRGLYQTVVASALSGEGNGRGCGGCSPAAVVLGENDTCRDHVVIAENQVEEQRRARSQIGLGHGEAEIEDGFVRRSGVAVGESRVRHARRERDVGPFRTDRTRGGSNAQGLQRSIPDFGCRTMIEIVPASGGDRTVLVQVRKELGLFEQSVVVGVGWGCVRVACRPHQAGWII